MNEYVLGFGEIDRSMAAVVGGKGAQLGELSGVDGVEVPAGFCVTTAAYRLVTDAEPSIAPLVERLSGVELADRAAVGGLSAELRRAVETAPVPAAVAAAIERELTRFGPGAAFAVRSSATAEDLPTASFAGQQDTYLNVPGAAVLEHVRRCWASLYTERAVVYRARNGFGQDRVQMAVVVQLLVEARAAGVLFTADPVSSDRTITTVEAIVGLGESLVSGQVDPDVYRLRGGTILSREVGGKQRAVVAVPGGGTGFEKVEAPRRDRPALTDAQVLALTRLGERIEAHYEAPQDIEWCLAEDGFHIVQSRPITTLFPVPDAEDDANRVYLSVGHQQMMTDAMKPLGLSVWQLTTPAPMAEAGGRLFVDVTKVLREPASREKLVDTMGKSDPLMADAMRTVLDRGFVPEAPGGDPVWTPPGAGEQIDSDPGLVDELIERIETSIAAAKRELDAKAGPELFDAIAADIPRMRQVLHDAHSIQVIMAGMQAGWWLNENLLEWLGEKNPADTLAQSVPHNVTSQMGLDLLDVADAIRPHPEVLAFLRENGSEDFLRRLPELDGGVEARDAVQGYLDAYGMRCVGEVDITRPRWSEQPTALLPIILANVDNFGPGAGRQRFERGRREALDKERELLKRLRELPDGEAKAKRTKEKIDRLRMFTGYREYPKYSMICRYFLYKRAMTAEAGRLVADGVLREVEDAFFLRFEELREVVRTRSADHGLIRRRRKAYAVHLTLSPPRVLTSDGEAVSGSYRRADLPAGALVGLPVSAGTVEGRARVVRDLAEADPRPGDILVTAHTDPSWSPLFVAVAGLVTEVGGLMTHGAVIAREYGLPAVVGVEGATRLITDGRHIRVNGTDGVIEFLDD